MTENVNLTAKMPGGVRTSLTTGVFGHQTVEEAQCSDSSSSGEKAMDVFVGDMLIVAGQVVMAFQGVYEEKVLCQYDVHPMVAVGWEGFWGFSVLSILLVPFGYWKVGDMWAHGPHGYFEEALDGFTQVGRRQEVVFECNPQLSNNNMLVTWFVLTMFSIAFFNFSGMYVTQKVSATARTVLDSVRYLRYVVM